MLHVDVTLLTTMSQESGPAAKAPNIGGHSFMPSEGIFPNKTFSAVSTDVGLVVFVYLHVTIEVVFAEERSVT